MKLNLRDKENNYLFPIDLDTHHGFFSIYLEKIYKTDGAEKYVGRLFDADKNEVGNFNMVIPNHVLYSLVWYSQKTKRYHRRGIFHDILAIRIRQVLAGDYGNYTKGGIA